jgi:hypothetical protein
MKPGNSMRDTVMPIRFIIYGVTFVYGLYNIFVGAPDNVGMGMQSNGLFASVAAATFIGIVQFVAILLAFGLEINKEKHHGLVKLCLLIVSGAYVYEGFLIASAVGIDQAFFYWLSFMALGTITGATFLSYDEDVKHKEDLRVAAGL